MDQRHEMSPDRTGPPAITKVLIANRGEIAVRVARAAADCGLTSVAVYADQDRDALHVRLADEAYALEGSVVADTYLDQVALLRIAARSGADAVHPGYGFLAENAHFAQAVIDAGLVWVGPSPKAIRTLGDKVSARAVARDAGAPLIPGSAEPLDHADQVAEFAREHGLPVAIKAAHGGGGRGLRVAHTLAEIPEAFASAQREALAAFGRGECFVERFLTTPRHVETQCLADAHGNVRVISTRDCSVQRRHQKLVEEAPAPFLDAEQDARLRAASRAVLGAVGYVGAATVEFLLGPDGTLGFLEVNTRLQVEHPVSEQVTGVDLVAEQFRLATGGELPDADPVTVGHAIEFRINAEDPGRDFLPVAGVIDRFEAPAGPGVRVDAGIAAPTQVSAVFDSLLAKVIVTGATREQALARARRALAETRVDPLTTVLGFHRALVEHPDFVAADGVLRVHTGWIADQDVPALIGARPTPNGGTAVVDPAEPPDEVELTDMVIEVDGRRVRVRLPVGALASAGRSAATVGRSRRRGRGRDGRPSAPSWASALTAPMPGTVVSVAVREGQAVSAGDRVAVLEAMKMEQPVLAHRDGQVSGLAVTAGDSVAAGELLCEIVDQGRPGSR